MERVTSQISPWVEGAINAHTLGAPGRWEVAFATAANNQGGLSPVLLLYIEIPSPLVGQKLSFVAQFPAEAAREQVAEVVSAMMNELTKLKLAALSATNGHGAVPGKLHLP